jgi:post-segregation antitoxin (ccd killing protein)
MPRIQLYLPDDLYQEVKSRGLPASEILQIAVRAVVEREKSREGLEQYIWELEEEIGSPSDEQNARADAIVRNIQLHQLQQAG